MKVGKLLLYHGSDQQISHVDTIVNEDDIDGIMIQISKGYCDNLFYIDPDSYFSSVSGHFRPYCVPNI